MGASSDGKTIDARHKTDLRIPKELYATIEEIAKDQLGIPVNAFFTMAASHYAGMVSANVPGKKRRELLQILKREFQKMIDKALESA
jgi:hypothetical protein